MILKIPLSQNLVYKVQIDTYKREIERYGAGNLSDSEVLFYQDSKTTLNFLIANNLQNDKSRWLYGLAIIDVLLDSFAYRAATVETLALFGWIRRFAEGLIQGESDGE